MFSIIAHFITYQDPQFIHVKNTKNLLYFFFEMLFTSIILLKVVSSFKCNFLALNSCVTLHCCYFLKLLSDFDIYNGL